MPLIFWVAKLLTLEDVPQMPAAVVAHNLRPHHTKTRIRALSNGTGNGIPKRRPSTARVKLVIRLIQWRLAAQAGIDARGRVVLVERSRARGLSPLVAQDAELL
jgi:hypothetical protein